MKIIKHEKQKTKYFTTVEWTPWYSWLRLLIGKRPIPRQQCFVSDNNVIFYFYPDITPCDAFANHVLFELILTHTMQESMKNEMAG